MKNAKRQNAPLISYNLKRIKMNEKGTRRQQKHDMLLAFMANKTRTPQPAPKPSLLKTLLSVLF